MIDQTILKKFINLYEKKYLVKLNEQDAFNLFGQLVQMVKIINNKKTI